MIHRILIAGAAALALGGTAMAAPSIPEYIQKAVADPGRPAADTSRDANRHPGALLAFAGVHPGMKVVDLLPGAGYFTRIFAKTVGPTGHVYAYLGTQYDARLKARGENPNDQLADLKAQYANVSVLHTPLEQFATPEKVDLVWTSDNYHDLHNKAYGVDPVKVDKAVFDSLKPGGIFMVIDHRAAKGAGLAVTGTLHRMDEDIAKKEIESVGFKLMAESNILANPKDDRNKRVFGPGEHDHTDQFVLKFRKP